MLGISTTPAPPKVSSGSSGEATFPGITADFAAQVPSVGKTAAKLIAPDLNPADAGAKGVFFAYCAGDDGLKIHHHFFEEMFSAKLLQWKQTCLVGIAFRSCCSSPAKRSAIAKRACNGVHAQNAANINFAGA